MDKNIPIAWWNESLHLCIHIVNVPKILQIMVSPNTTRHPCQFRFTVPPFLQSATLKLQKNHLQFVEAARDDCGKECGVMWSIWDVKLIARRSSLNTCYELGTPCSFLLSTQILINHLHCLSVWLCFVPCGYNTIMLFKRRWKYMITKNDSEPLWVLRRRS